jgi:UDPglucose 6-dehydrogenase
MEDGSADLKYVLGVARQIAQYMNGYKVIVDKSTVPVGTADKVRDIMLKETTHNFDVVSNPEFLKEGAAVQDFLKPDRVVIGSSSKRAIDIMKELFAPFVRTGNPMIVMSERSAELTKYVANAFLATKISFMNEIANLCEKVGADVDDVRIGMGTDYRIGPQFLFPGTGWGGSCFPKDVKALIRTAEEHGYGLSISRATEQVNERQKYLIVNKISTHYKTDSLRDKVFAIWGLSFKPRTDDIRDAPSIVIIRSLLEKGAKIKAHDPIANEAMKRYLGGVIEYCDISYDAVRGADGLVIVTEWNEFRRPDFAKMKQLMREPVVFDGRNIYDPQKMRERGFIYYGIGRK